jgi:hypothetical protein
MILVLPAYQQPSNIHAGPRPPLELSLITLKIHHKTTYRYRQPVSLGPHRLIVCAENLIRVGGVRESAILAA